MTSRGECRTCLWWKGPRAVAPGVTGRGECRARTPQPSAHDSLRWAQTFGDEGCAGHREDRDAVARRHAELEAAEGPGGTHYGHSPDHEENYDRSLDKSKRIYEALK